MENNALYFKKSILEIGKLSLPDSYPEGVIRLDANENPFQTPVDVVNEYINVFKEISLNRYPDFLCNELKRKLAYLYNVKPEQVLLGNGSTELIHLCLFSIAPPGSKIMIAAPSFFFFEREILVNDKTPVFFKRNSEFELDDLLFFDAIRCGKPKMIILASPDNPTGLTIDNFFLEQVLKEFKDTIVIVDEVYSNFSGLSSSSILENYENLIILKSFSKIGFAGLRLGILLGNERHIAQLNKAKLPYNVNSLTIGLSHLIIEKFDAVQAQITNIVKERERVKNVFSNYAEVKITNSKANFNFIQMRSEGPDRFYDFLLEKGILIKKFAENNFPNCYRISVGTKRENDYLIEMTDSYFKS